MADQYDINYKQQVIDLLPPDKRYKNIVAYLQDCCISTVQYLRDAILGDYRNGVTVSAWVSGNTYSRGNKVIYKNAVFVSLINSNTDIPTNTTSWYMQQQFFIGLSERLAYNGNNLVFTYALNRWFGTTFRQPGIGLSDIYITTNPINPSTFKVGYVSTESSWVGSDISSDPITYSSTFGVQYNCTIHVPTSLITSLGSAAYALLDSYINQYIYAGLTYQVVAY